MILGIESDDLKRCLCDVHCDKEIVKRVCSCYSEQKTREVKRLLYQERKQILSEIHNRQHDLDHIDHLIWQLDHKE